MGTERPPQAFVHGHGDIVLAADYNFYGNRLVTASSDHHLKVWDKNGERWDLVDSWRAHDAEVTDVKWNGPYTGQILGSIGEDGYFKLWSEDQSQSLGSSKRFRLLIAPMYTKSVLPWVSLDFKNIDSETYLALITRDGDLAVMQPKDNDPAGDWFDWMEGNFLVCGTQPSRSEETSFRVSWHKEKVPCWTAVQSGLDRRALSIAVAAMNAVKVYRTDSDRKLYMAAELTGATDLVRDVAWSNGSMRGFDVIATAGKDGFVRVYELRTKDTKPPFREAGSVETKDTASIRTVGRSSQSSQPSKNQSGIGAGLAESRGGLAAESQHANPSRVKTGSIRSSALAAHSGAVWRVMFSSMGDLLISTGDDGKVRTWKRNVKGSWLEYAEMDVKSVDSH